MGNYHRILFDFRYLTLSSINQTVFFCCQNQLMFHLSFKDTFSSTNELPLSSISFTITPASLIESHEKVNPITSCLMLTSHIAPMATNDLPILTCTCSHTNNEHLYDLVGVSKTGNFRKFSISKPTADSTPMTIAIYSSSCPASTCLSHDHFSWEDIKSEVSSMDTLFTDSNSFENFLDTDLQMTRRTSVTEMSFCYCNKDQSAILDPINSVQQLSSTVFYKVASFMRIRANFENTILNFTTKTTNKRPPLLSNLSGSHVNYPIKSQTKFVTKHNPDTSPTSHSTSSVRRHQRHSIAGQMSYFKMLGLGGLGKKMAASTSSLFSTAVISGSGSNSAPNLRDMITNTSAQSGDLK